VINLFIRLITKYAFSNQGSLVIYIENTCFMNKFTHTIHTYNKIADHYAKYVAEKCPKEDLEKFIQHLPNNALVLDVGCAAGRDTALFSMRGFEVVGIDLSENLLEIAREKYPEIEFIKMDMRRLKFEDEIFDGIWANATILHLPRKDVPQALSEFHRVLKADGILHVGVKRGEGVGFTQDQYAANERRYFTYFELEEMEQLVREAGFEIIDSFIDNPSKRKAGSRNIDWVKVFARKLR
jgi:ubiquinone/menaquinone biosynthesis C-methylase UbiE